MRAPAVLPTPARSFGADTLACALALTGRTTPTPAELATALAELYPNDTGPTVPDLVAAGWLVPTVDGRGLRQPPLTPAELDARLTEPPKLNNAGVLPAPALVNSRNKAEIESDFSEAHSRAKAGGKSEFSESLKREIDGIKTEQPPTPELLAAIGAAVGYPNGKGGKLC